LKYHFAQKNTATISQESAVQCCETATSSTQCCPTSPSVFTFNIQGSATWNI